MGNLPVDTVGMTLLPLALAARLLMRPSPSPRTIRVGPLPVDE
jgi:hypothetical protein